MTTPYDRVRYPSSPFWESHPDRLRLVAHLFHLETAPAERCRVLEVGCAAGGNLIPMAATLPDSRFLGIDLAASAIAEGQRTSAALGLQNLELRALDLAALPPGEGLFDYIIAHGVYSWIPAASQRALLDLFARHLAPGGVGYLSHNVKPGSHDRLIAYEMMRWHAGRGDGSAEQVEQARTFLAFIARSTRVARWGDRMEAQLQLVKDHPDWLVRHDALGEHTSACWFHELATALEERGLEYLGDSDIGSMLPRRYDDETRALLDRLAGDQIRLEQLLDFLGHRAFRLTLVARRGAAIDRSIDPRHAATLHYSVDMTEGADGVFRTAAGAEVTIGPSPTRLALQALAKQAPASLSFAELVERAGAAGPQVDELSAGLLELVIEGFVSAALTPARCVYCAGARPLAPAHVRLQARGGLVTNLHHRTIRVGSDVATLLQHLDGTHDRAALRVLTQLADDDALEDQLDLLAEKALLLG